MRDPDLMQRADRAAIGLEQAWERWRAMHGLGSEPLPPVSSYVGYSLDEPWGQPRVVFGLRADEAELLASLLEGHECTGSVYPELGSTHDWRLPVSGPVSIPGRGYGGTLSVPAQAPPPRADVLAPGLSDGFAIGRPADEDSSMADEPDGDGGRSRPIRGGGGSRSARGRTGRGARSERGGGRTLDTVAGSADTPRDRDAPGWSATNGNPAQAQPDDDAEPGATDLSQAPPLVPLPDMSDARQRSDEAESDELSDELDDSAVAPRPGDAPTSIARGPGNRGPRYRGFPPRYEDGSGAGHGPVRPSVAAEDDDDSADADIESAPVRKTHVGKLARSARRRTQSG